ncbi:MAG TPA: methyl-accepting chemotaxis protein [Tepidisphaeraceae bacterium]|jgi:methyl-accepting chemotaxis protein|nr:methyl-accepting chemotaxis protein [Tepidisphaeraceae bacterium]
MKWTVGLKIGIGFGLASVIFAAVSITSYISMIKLTTTADWVAHTHRVIEDLDGLSQSLTDAETGQRGYIITGNDDYLGPYHIGTAAIDRYVIDLRQLILDNPEQQKKLELFQYFTSHRLSDLNNVMEVLRTKGFDTARQAVLAGKGRDDMLHVREVIAIMKETEASFLKQRSEDAHESAEKTKLIIIGGACTGLLTIFLASYLITRNISTPLRDITATARRLSEGDLDVTVITSNRTDEVGSLTRAFGLMTESLRGMAEVAGKIAGGDLRVNVKPQSGKDVLGNAFALMIENLRRLTSQITEGAGILAASASQISASTTQLVSSSTETAAALAETTTTVEEVRQTAQVSSEKSRTVSDSAQQVAQTAHAGRKSTEATVDGIQRIRQQMDSIADGMSRLSEQTQAIGQIIAAVDDLAAQSNLLAVNAAIEAAKAGDQGRGFAVVAQEVRSLAEQSKQATSQVRTILSDIQKATTAAVLSTEQGAKAVDAGVKQSGEAGRSIEALSSSMTDAARMATQIAASSQQQLVGMDQVAAAMESVKQASTQNVSSAKQLEAAARGLNDLGRQLKQTTEKYRA